MSKKKFDDFLKSEEQKKKPAVDWEGEKRKWFEHLDKLYGDIQEWLKEYIISHKLKLEFNDIEIYEEALGTYSVKELKIFIGDKIATLTPKGTILIGTKGRVDLKGKAGNVKFILADKKATGPKFEIKINWSGEEKHKDSKTDKIKPKPQIDWTWKITSNPPSIKYTELNQDTFLQCLLEVIND